MAKRNSFVSDVKRGFGLAVGAIIALVVLSALAGWLPLPGSAVQEGGETGGEGAATIEPLPLKIFVTDPLSGGGVSGTAYVINMETHNTIESITIDSTGAGTSTRFYDYQVYIWFSASGYVSAPIVFDPADAKVISVGDQDYYEVDLEAYDEPSESEFAMLCFDETGSILADESTGNTYSMSGTETDITIQLTVPKGSALINYYDYLEGDDGEHDNLVLLIAINSTLATLDTGTRVEVGNTTYYIITVEDIIATKTDAAVLRETVTLYYGGSDTLAISVSFYNNVDPDIIASSLSADSDTTLSDSLATFYIA